MNRLKSLRLPYFTALIPVGILLLRVPYMQPLLDNPSLWIALLTSLVTFVIALLLAGQLKERLWAGYIHLAVMATWLTIGLGAGLIVVIAGSILAALIRHRLNLSANGNDFDPVEESAGRIAISGMGLLVAFGVLYLLGRQTPVQMLSASAVPPLVIAILSSFAASQAVGYLLVNRDSFHLPTPAVNLVILELLLIGVALIVPVIFYRIGTGGFIIIMGLTAFQALRYYQVTDARNALMRRMRETTTLYNLGQAISNNLVLEDVLKRVYQEVNRLVNATTFFIALYDDDRRMIDYPLVMVNGKPAAWDSRKPAQGMTDRILRSHSYLLINSSENARFEALNIRPEEVDSAAFLGVPLLVGPKIVGVMGVVHQTDVHAFKSSDVAIMQTIASQAGLAIRNASLYARTVHMADNLSLINHSLQEVMFNLDQQDAMQTACRIAREVTGAQKAAIFLLQNRTGVVALTHSIGFEDDESFALEAPNQPQVYETGSRSFYDVREVTDDTVRQHADLGHFRACLEVPLRSGNTVIGYIAVYHEMPHYYEPMEVNLLEMLTNQITAALDNAELLQALEMYASEQAQLVHLSRISSSNLELDRLIYDVCGTLQQMMDMERIEIGLFLPDRNRIQVFHTAGQDGELQAYDISATFIPELNILLQDSVLNVRVFYNNSPRSAQLTALMFGNRDTTLALVPMLINRKVTGIIFMGTKERREFTDNDRRLVEMATNQIAGQIHNARIHALTEEALVQRLQQLSMIEDIAGQISRSLEPDMIINSVLDAALRSTGADLSTLGLLEEHNDTFLIISQEIVEGETQRRVYTRPTSEGIMGHVARSGMMVLEGNNRSLDQYVSDSHQIMLSTLAVPLKKGDTVIGVLNIESTQANFFTPEQGGFIKSLAGHAAISIDNARMLEERQNQITTLTYLRELTLKASTLFEQQGIVRAILETALKTLQGQSAVLFSYDSSTHEIVITGNASLDGENFPAIPADLVYDTVQKGEAQFLNRVDQSPYYQTEEIETIEYFSLVAIPLFYRAQVHEVLCITFGDVKFFGGRERDTIALIASQISGHLENAALNDTVRNSNNRMRAILDATRDGVILLDRAGRIQESNRAAAEILSVDLGEHTNALYSRVLQEYFGNGTQNGGGTTILSQEHSYQDVDSATREYTLTRRNQTVYIMELVLPVQDAGGRFVGSLLVLRDVTEERELARYRQKIQDMVLHDLSKPLTSIVTGMDFSMDALAESEDESLKELLNTTMQITLDSARSLLNLVASLRDLPGLGKGEMRLERRQVGVRRLAEDAYHSLEFSLKEANIRLEYQIADDAAHLEVDNDLIRRVFINLLHNAFKFTPPGGEILIKTQANSDKPGYLKVLICDSGPGVPEDMRERIFDEFVQIEGLKPHQGGKGSGVGLAFCKLAVEAHGGTIRVEAAGPLPGACFGLTLPAAIEPVPAPQQTPQGE